MVTVRATHRDGRRDAVDTVADESGRRSVARTLLFARRVHIDTLLHLQ